MRKLWLGLVVASCIVASPFVSAEGKNLNILLVSNLSAGASSSMDFLDSFRSTLKDSGYKAEIFLENLDVVRLPSRVSHSEGFLGLLAERYRDMRLDIILAQSTQAVEMAIDFRDAYFPGTPVFCFDQIDPEVVNRYASEPDVYGRILKPPLLPTVRLATRLLPSAKKGILLVTGASPETVTAYTDTIDALREELPLVSFFPLFNADCKTVEQALKGIGSDSFAVFLPGGWKLDDGTFLTGTDMVEYFQARFKLPFFGVQTSTFGTGLMGGALIDYAEMGKDSGAMAIDILFDTHKPVPWLFSGTSRDTLDYRTLSAFHVAASSIPEGTELLYTPQSFWIRYERELKTFLLVLLTCLAILLFVVMLRMRENVMLRRSIRQSMIESEGNRLQSRLLANLNHEINTPLGNALVASSVIAESTGDVEERIPGFGILSRALNEMQGIANDRSFFWNPGARPMDTREFTSLLDRMVRRSMIGARFKIEYAFGAIGMISETAALLRCVLHAVDFLGHLVVADSPSGRGNGTVVIKISLVSRQEANGSGEWILSITDNASSILAPWCSTFLVGKRRTEAGLLHEGHLPKLLSLDHHARCILGGSFFLERTKEDYNRIVIRFPVPSMSVTLGEGDVHE